MGSGLKESPLQTLGCPGLGVLPSSFSKVLFSPGDSFIGFVGVPFVTTKLAVEETASSEQFFLSVPLVFLLIALGNRKGEPGNALGRSDPRWLSVAVCQ